MGDPTIRIPAFQSGGQGFESNGEGFFPRGEFQLFGSYVCDLDNCCCEESVMDPKITLPSDDWTLKSEAKSYIEEYDSFPRSDFACMHPEISLLSDDSILKSTATSKRMEVVVNELASIDMDEDLNDIINKISKIVFHKVPDADMDEDLNNLVNTMRKCTLAISSCATKKDSILSEGYKSEIKKIIEGYSTKDVPWEQDAQSSRMTRIDEEDAQNRRINFKKFVNHSDHLSSTCTSPIKKASAFAVIDEITDVEKDAALIDLVNKKRKEGTMASTNGAGRLDSKDNDRSTKKAHYDPWPYILSVKSSEKYKCELRRRIEETITRVGIYSLKDVTFDPYDARNSPMVRIYDEDVVKRYENFKKFEIVLDHSDHLFSGRIPISQRYTEWAKTIHEDWRTLEENLPDTIFVRAYEPRKDLLRAVIIGAEGTPYHDGLFFFDLHFPTAYPLVPPVVRYHSGGLGINPNLYTSGEVCLSLPTTQHKREELWVPNTSTLLQLLVSIQDQYFTTDPIYCALGFVTFRGNVGNSHYSVLYNESTFIASIKTMVYIMNKPPKNFEAFVVGHFRNRVRDILMACKAYIEGVQVGRVVSGEGNENCTLTFRYDVTRCIKPLIAAFIKIGANEAQEFLYLSEKRSIAASAPTPVTKSIRMTATQSRLRSTGPLCN
ncbi:putative ubiquitin-conjugating enzyme E2 [Tanacetum coccineum]